MTNRHRDLSLERSKFAWECATDAKNVPENNYKEYVTLVKNVPTSLSNNGLGQTLAFLNSKPNNKAYKILYGQLQEWLTEKIYNSSLLRAESFRNVLELAKKLSDENNILSQYIYNQLAADTQELLNRSITANRVQEPLLNALLTDLNNLLCESFLYEEERFEEVNLRKETKLLLAQAPTAHKPDLLNRLLFEDAYPSEVKRSEIYQTPKGKLSLNIIMQIQDGEVDQYRWATKEIMEFVTWLKLHSSSLNIEPGSNDDSTKATLDITGKTNVSGESDEAKKASELKHETSEKSLEEKK